MQIMRIEELRTERGYPQEALAAYMGVALSVLEQWEREVTLPTSRQLPLLAALLGCEIGALYTEEARTGLIA